MITARFTTRCWGCHSLILDGDTIEREAETGQWVHLDCLPLSQHPDADGPHREACPVCHTVRTVTGACLCEEDGAA